MKKRNLFFTFLVVVLSLAMVASIAVSAATATPYQEANDAEDSGRIEFNKGQKTAITMTPESIVASHFSIAADATFIGASCACWGEGAAQLRVSLYAFDTNYDTTLKGTPIADHFFEDFADNEYLGFTFDSADPLKAGEYVITLTEASANQILAWKCSDYEGQKLFVDDERVPYSSLMLGVKFVNAPEGDIFGKLTGYEDEEAVINTKPNLDNMLVFDNDDIVSELVEAGTGCNDFYIEEDKYLHINVEATGDSQIKIKLSKEADGPVYCDESTAILIKLRRSEDTPTAGEIFFSTSLYPGPQGGGSVVADYEDTTDWQYVIFNMAANTNYTKEGATLDFIRFDIFKSANEEATFDIEYILFFDNIESAQAWDKDIDTLLGRTPTAAPTDAPEATQAPATDAPEATQAPATEAPKATDAPAEEKEGGCGSSVILAHAMLVIGAAMIIKKKK